MAWVGVVGQVAGIAASVIGSLFGATVDVQHGKDKDYHCELDDGKRWAILSKYVMIHPNPALTGKAYAIGKVGEDIGVDLDGPGAVVFQLAEDDSTPPVKKLWAINTSTSTDFTLGFSNTDGDGSTSNPQIGLPRATNTYRPYWQDTTGFFGSYPTGKIVITPNSIAPSPTVLFAMAKLGITDPAPTQTLVSNFQIDNIVSDATYKLWTGALTTQYIQWAWNTDTSGNITGATVTNLSGEDVLATAILSWDNPAQSFTATFVASGTTTTTTSTTFATSVNRPLTSASISLTQNATPAQEKALFKIMIDRQIAAGQLRSVKYMYM